MADCIPFEVEAGVGESCNQVESLLEVVGVDTAASDLGVHILGVLPAARYAFVAVFHNVEGVGEVLVGLVGVDDMLGSLRGWLSWYQLGSLEHQVLDWSMLHSENIV